MVLALVGDLCWDGSQRKYDSIIKQIRSQLRALGAGGGVINLEPNGVEQHNGSLQVALGMAEALKDPVFHLLASVSAFHTGLGARNYALQGHEGERIGLWKYITFSCSFLLSFLQVWP